MSHLKRTFLFLGFFFQYLFPLILFGNVFPYTHDSIKAGLTKSGFFALGLLLLFICKRVKFHVIKMKNATIREIILSVFPVLLWLLINLGMNALMSTVQSLSVYWSKVILFVVIGRLFYITAGVFESQEDKDE